MPAILDDPDTPTIYRVSGAPPYPDPAHPALPASIVPRHVTLRDRQTVATVVPFASRHEVPESLLRYLNDQFNKEIEGGDTYPMVEGMAFDKFASYWFQNFGAIMLLGHITSAADVVEGQDWARTCLGTFYIKPNYPGRSSHVCNAGFIVTDASRNRGVGRLMGETYLLWAPKLGYTYSVFNLVYETNVASCKIWDALGFRRIGRVKGCGNLKSYPGQLVDAIIYGRELSDGDGDGSGGGAGEEFVSEDRFDRIKFYLKYGRYPIAADRAEKSRLRSAATHYKLTDGDVLMLKDKEVISDPRRQYDIARDLHRGQAHAGINKTTATIAERYHWSRIKETVSDVIRNCAECKELGKAHLPLLLSSAPATPTAAAVAAAAAVPGTPAASSAGVATAGVKRPNVHAMPSAPSSKRSSPSPSMSMAAATTVAEAVTTMAPRSVPVSSEQSHNLSFLLSQHYPDPHDLTGIAPSRTTFAGHSNAADSGAVSGHDHQAHFHPQHHSAMLRDVSNVLQPAYRGHSHISHQHRYSPTESASAQRNPRSPTHRMPTVSMAMPVSLYQPIDPQIISQSPHHQHHPVPHHRSRLLHEDPDAQQLPQHAYVFHSHDAVDSGSDAEDPGDSDPDVDAFQALLDAASVDPALHAHEDDGTQRDNHHSHHHHGNLDMRGTDDGCRGDDSLLLGVGGSSGDVGGDGALDDEAVDRDMEMLLEQQDDADDDDSDDDDDDEEGARMELDLDHGPIMAFGSTCGAGMGGSGGGGGGGGGNNDLGKTGTGTAAGTGRMDVSHLLSGQVHGNLGPQVN